MTKSQQTNITYKVKSINKYGRNAEKGVATEPSHVGDGVFAIVEKLVIEWGKLAIVPDGEDTSGRQKFRPMTVSELVDRSFEAAELTIRRGFERDHMVPLPSVLDDHDEAAS